MACEDNIRANINNALKEFEYHVDDSEIKVFPRIDDFSSTYRVAWNAMIESGKKRIGLKYDCLVNDTGYNEDPILLKRVVCRDILNIFSPMSAYILEAKQAWLTDKGEKGLLAELLEQHIMSYIFNNISESVNTEEKLTEEINAAADDAILYMLEVIKIATDKAQDRLERIFD
ncbi:MAG: hypothetical protein U9N61_10125 [Euryarchaeota archaeon]|nr:hypothetical protein [Euryarchaeota archaeon]